MALKVWLPLNGDLRNQGCNNVEITNNNATINDSGKIGKCYSFNGSNAKLTETFPVAISSSIGSLSCWVKFNSLPTSSGFYSLLQLGNLGGYATCRLGLYMEYSNYINISINGSSTGTNRYTHSIVANQWYHICTTYDGSIVKLYINGTEVLSKNATSGSYLTSSSCLFIGGTSSYYLNGYLNDARYYDHCLSAAEVHKIAQGLALHYKLDGINNASVLPSQYQQLEYIESAGTSYFNTGYKFNAEIDSCKVVFKGNDTSNNGMIFASSGTKYFWFYYYGSNGIRIYAHNGSDGQKGITGISSDLIQHTMEFKNKTYYIDDVNKGSLTDTYTDTTNDIWLFSYNNNGYPFKGRIYYVEIKKNNQYQRMFIPAKRLDDSAIGMYDLITNTFYTSSNVAFTAGTAVGTLTIEDSSGYGYNGTINGTLTVSSNTTKYSSCIYMPKTTTITHPRPIYGGTDQEWTCCMWVKLDTTNQASQQMNNFNAGNNIVHGANGKPLLYLNSGANDYYNYGNLAVSAGVWTHIAFVFKNSNVTKLIYINGENHTNTSGPNKTSTPYGIQDTVTVGYNLAGYISDYRVYCTALLDNDIKMLYNVGMKIDNLGKIHTFDFIENKNNLMWRPESARAAGKGINYNEGLGSYTQANCQVTCDANGYRIYRPPNLTVSANGNTMYGGLRVRNSTNSGVHVYNATTDNIFGLVQGHTYIFIISVKGQSSNSAGLGITNNMGWGGGGLTPSPTNVISGALGSNFEGEKEVYYKFTVSDNVVKTCTSSYSAFTSGNQYLSYMDFTFNFSYTDTGTLGTDLYITNIGLYDITNITTKLNKNGTLNITSLLENKNIAKIYQSGITKSTDFIEI